VRPFGEAISVGDAFYIGIGAKMLHALQQHLQQVSIIYGVPRPAPLVPF
jgi:hypothetical protein